ncbi:MAG TPA: twin-arginine translocase TatA/TatE family subunit [Longimicrobiaceae bacterium]|jgi:sec-independent protein translocase protein TatA|nr:twin-arginine translocase TatA/TatE family subunit [Longimicrobiaceae bacterium]
MPFGLGFGELVLIFAVMLLFFGAKRLPEVAGGMGKGIREFKRSISGLDEDSIQAGQTPPAVPPQAAATPLPTESEPKRLG